MGDAHQRMLELIHWFELWWLFGGRREWRRRPFRRLRLRLRLRLAFTLIAVAGAIEQRRAG
jgi:hypothetical protein